ncbi:MAG: hypothetical protein QOH31_4512, partial [Verrucomicrobiota bacterium]
MVTSLRSKWAAGGVARQLRYRLRYAPSFRQSGPDRLAGGPFLNATRRAAAGWLFFRVARSFSINLDMLVAPPPINLLSAICYLSFSSFRREQLYSFFHGSKF